MIKLETEADVINLVGYETPMNFEVLSEGIITYSNEKHQLDLFSRSDKTSNEFLAVDSFSEFLSDYQIFELIDKETTETLYSRTWEDDFDSNSTNLGIFLNRCGVKERFDKRINELSVFPLKDIYRMDDWVIALGNSFLFSDTGKEADTWGKVLEAAIEEQQKRKTD